jgi:hypothetical protein
MDKKPDVVVFHHDLSGSGYVSSDPTANAGGTDGIAPLVFDERKLRAPTDCSVEFGANRILYK